MTWETVKGIRDTTTMKVVLEEILAYEDAEMAVKAGVDGIIVSNHGARSEDSGRSTIDALPEILQAVTGGCRCSRTAASGAVPTSPRGEVAERRGSS
jgi:isopentenyl diphosphate isomerase/L-lactate dehydrogenase-like FMN-dependent dehydrogenase